MKKTLSLMLALLICMSLLPVSVLASEDAALLSNDPLVSDGAEGSAAWEEPPVDSNAPDEEPMDPDDGAVVLSEESGEPESGKVELYEADDPTEELSEDYICEEFDDTVYWDAAPEDTFGLWLDGASLTESQVRARLSEVYSNYPDGASWNTSFEGGIQCYGFAKLVVYSVFGRTSYGYTRSWNYDGSGNSGMFRVGSVQDCTEDSVRTLLSRAKPGDVLQFDRGPNGHQHSMIVYDVTSSGVRIYENNWVGYNVISLRTMTFREFAQRQYESGVIGGAKRRGTLSLVRCDNYDTTSTQPIATGLEIYDAQYPEGQIPRGKSFYLRGVIMSDTTITDITANIYNASGDSVMTYRKNPGTMSYNIQSGGLDDAFLFGKLPVGSYRYVVKATDAHETKTLIDSEFYVESKTTYTVAFNANEGSGAPAAQTKIHGTALILSSAVPERRGWNFLGWADSASARTAQYQPGDSYTQNADTVLYAVWEQEVIVVPAAPVILIEENGKTARVKGTTEGLFARVALVVDNGESSGLIVSQTEIRDDGTVEIPTVSLPGLRVTAVSIVLVSTLNDISSPTPDAVVSIFKFL